MASSRKKRVVDETASDCDEVAEDMSDEDTDESEHEFMNQVQSTVVEISFSMSEK